jgi:hypothetical protein
MAARRKVPSEQAFERVTVPGQSRYVRESIRRAKHDLANQTRDETWDSSVETGQRTFYDRDIERTPNGWYYVRDPGRKKTKNGAMRRRKPRASAVATIRLTRRVRQRSGIGCYRVRQLEWLPGEGSDGLDETECK